MHRRISDEGAVVEPFLLVRDFRPLSETDKARDPYRVLAPHLDIFLCYNELETDYRLIRLQDVHGHFAAYMFTPTDIGKECIVVRALDRE